MSFNSSILGSHLTPGGHHFYTEMATEFIYSKAVRAGDTVFDLGANRAHHTTKLLRAVGDTGLVHAFEPNPDLFAGLAGLSANLRLWPFAVGDCLRVVELHVPDGLDGWSSLQDIRNELLDRGFKIRTTVQVALDELLELRDVDVSFIKTDVARHEMQAIRGMTRLLRRRQPLVVCEGNTEDNFAAFKEVGYRCIDFFGGQAGGANVLANFLAYPPKWQDRIDAILPTRAEWEQASVIAATL